MELESIVETIIRSEIISEYLIGITRNSKQRRSSYKREKFDGYAIIDFNLSVDDALALEEKLFISCTKNKSSIKYKKYHVDKRDDAYHRSTGGIVSTADNIADNYDVYIAWFNA